KRTAREKEETYDYIAAEIMLDFLGVLDNMERAADSAAAVCGEGGSASLKEGIDMVIKQFRDILAKYHVEEIPTEGVKFDPNFHHAVMRVEDSDKEEGTILEVFQKGYKIKSRVLRPSFVKVAL
ncbi:MAG TPA: nucleotide exchange factor GrpE, partial [Bacillota bacterium]|nr:nucleotide exchange factor GrpE [Bacillota bacterium]